MSDIFFELIRKIVEEEAELARKTRTYERAERESRAAEDKRKLAHQPVSALHESIAIHREALTVMSKTKHYSNSEMETIIQRYREGLKEEEAGPEPTE